MISGTELWCDEEPLPLAGRGEKRGGGRARRDGSAGEHRDKQSIYEISSGSCREADAQAARDGCGEAHPGSGYACHDARGNPPGTRNEAELPLLVCVSREAGFLRPARLIWPGVLVVGVGYGLARYTYGLFVPEIRAELGLSTEAIGLIASGSYAGFLLASALTAVVAARTGPRLPVVLGALSAAAGMLLIAVSEGPVLLTMGVTLAGTSPGFAYAPFSDAVVRLIPGEKQSRTYAVINAGTGFGVLFAGPVAIWAADSWRTAWLVFAALALVAAFWNGSVLPSGVHGGGDSGAALPTLRLRWFVGAKSLRLFSVALVIGVASSAYWTFAVDLATKTSSAGPGTGALFWTIVGASGIAGALAGDAVSRFGLRRALLLAILSLASSTALLAAAPGTLPAVLGSAILFGAAFIFATGIIGFWSIGVFYDRPSAGLGAAFFLLSLGQFVGPVAFAVVASLSSLEAAFYASAAIVGAAALIRPPADPGSGKSEKPAAR